MVWKQKCNGLGEPHFKTAATACVLALGATIPALAAVKDQLGPPPPVPAFSLDYLDRSVDPAQDFYHYADGTWAKQNPVPADKSRWAAFTELAERNWFLIHEILDEMAANSTPRPK
jgi:predicted metalloendopeptidase